MTSTSSSPHLCGMRPAMPIPEHVSARGAKAMVSTSHPAATEIALAVLRDGGSAADGYLAAALAQTVIEPDMTTLAGQCGLHFWSAAERSLAAEMGGGFSKPAALLDDGSSEITTDGRAVMVPGFVRGAWNAHQRWGKLPWKRLLAPAIEIAHEGFEVDWSLWGHAFEFRHLTGRTQEGRDVWQRQGRPVMIGERLRQPELACTLEGIRDHGVDYMYTGPWGRKFMEVVRAHGGVITDADMARGAGRIVFPEWRPGQQGDFRATTYRGYELAPTSGLMGLALNLVEAADLASRGPPAQSAETLYFLMRIAQQAWHSARLYNPKTHDALSSKDYARQLLPLIEHGPPLAPLGLRINTCGVTVADAEGNIATGTHSVSSSPFGVGYYVDGVALNRGIHVMRFGTRKFAGINTSALLFRDGRPVYVMSTPSRSFFEGLLQTLTYAVEFGMTIDEAVCQPRFGGTDEIAGVARIESSFPQATRAAVAARGMGLFDVAPWDYECGSMHAIHVRADGAFEGCADPRRRGMAKGY